MRTDEYLWERCQDFYPVAGVMQRGSGASLPVAVKAEKKNGTYVPTGYAEAADGDFDQAYNRKLLPGIVFTGPSTARRTKEKLPGATRAAFRK